MNGSPGNLRLLLFAAAGALLGYAIESIHHAAGVWRLPDDGPLPPWILLAYFAGLLGFAAAARRIARSAPLARPSSARAGAEAGLLALLAVAPPLGHHHEHTLAALVLALLALRLTRARARGDVALALGVALVDVALERLLVGAGLYRYANAAHGALPLWLGPLWACIALGLRRLLALDAPAVSAGSPVTIAPR